MQPCARLTLTAMSSSSLLGLVMVLPRFHMLAGSVMVTSPSHGWVNRLSHLWGTQSGRIHRSCSHLHAVQGAWV